MRKFKSILYGIYLFYFAFSAFIACFYEDIVLHWDWDGISTWTGLRQFVLQVGGVGSMLFVLEIIVENIHLYFKRRKIKTLEKDILALKDELHHRDNKTEKTVEANELGELQPNHDPSNSPEEKISL